MKKILLLVLLYSTSFFAQEENQLPNFTVPSPQAFEFTKYGNVSTNESSGQVNLSIPVYSYNVDDINLPISLSYSGGGVKVDQMTTWTGINWNLQAGGVITRTVNDGPDENPNFTRTFIEESDFGTMVLGNGTNDALLLNSYLSTNYNSQYDTEVDIFHFSFMGYSGSFYLNKLGIPTLRDNSDNLKIEVLGTTLINLFNNKEFIITDVAGTKYYFGGINAAEDTQTRDGSGQLLTHRATTGYYLNKIVSYKGDEVYFEYESIPLQNIALLNSKTLAKVDLGESLYSRCVSNANGICDEAQEYCFNYGGTLGGTSSSQSFNRVSDGKFLNKISNNKNALEVQFNSSFTSNAKISLKILNDVVITNNSTVIYKASLSYLDPNNLANCDRFFLEKVTLFDHNINDGKKQVYKLEYNAPEDLPARFSFDQDHLGYYNRIDNTAGNTTSLPKVDSNSVFASSNNTLANKNPLFVKASKGVLKKINYPTKGATEFEYEPNKKIVNVTDNISLHTFNTPSYNQDLFDYKSIHNNVSEYNTYTVDGKIIHLNYVSASIGEQIGVPVDQTITVNFGVNGAACTGINQRDFINFTVKDITTGVEEVFTRELCSLTTPAHFDLEKGHQYIFALRLYTEDSEFPNNTLIVDANFDSIIGQEYVEDLGIRIKRVSDYISGTAQPTNVKRFYYKKANYFEESLMNPFIPYYETESTFGDACTDAALCLWNYWTVRRLSSNGTDNLFYTSVNTAFYKYVTISYGGDNFEKGGTQKEFKLDMDNGVLNYHSPTAYFVPIQKRGNLGALNGKTIEEISFLSENNQLFKVKKKNYTWSKETLEVLPNLVGSAAYSICHYLTTSGYDNLLVGTYNFYSFHTKLTKQTTTDYIEPLALEADESSVKKIITTVDYEYGNLTDLPIKTTTTNSDGTQQIVKNYYPNQVTTTSSLNLQPELTSTELTSISNLNSQNRISPIQVENYEKIGSNPEVILNVQRSLYKEENGFTVLKNVSSSKNNSNFEERVVYHKYDTQGNPLELSKADGTKVVYMWATTHRKPLAKIVNTSLLEVQAVTGDLRTDLPNAQVTTYTYTGPLNLLSTVTDLRGYTTTYTYDEFNRLEYVKDAEGNILSKNEYNYRTQN